MELKLATQPNEKRCHTMKETHLLELKPCCPISGNPQAGSVLEIEYRVDERILEVEALRAYVDSYIGGRGDVRSMEGMCQQITQDCANAVQTMVHTRATLNIAPAQRMIVECSALVTSSGGGGAERQGRKTCPAEKQPNAAGELRPPGQKP